MTELKEIAFNQIKVGDHIRTVRTLEGEVKDLYPHLGTICINDTWYTNDNTIFYLIPRPTHLPRPLAVGDEVWNGDGNRCVIEFIKGDEVCVSFPDDPKMGLLVLALCELSRNGLPHVNAWRAEQGMTPLEDAPKQGTKE